MPMTTEEAQDYRDSARLLSAEELRGMIGDDAEQDVILNEILGAGKAVELKEPAEGDPPKAKAGTEEEEEEEEEEEDDDLELDPATGKPLVTPAPGADAAAAAAEQAAAAAQAEAAAAEAAAAAAAPKVDIPKLDLSYLDTDFKARQTALDTAKADSLGKLMTGEIEAADYAKVEAQYMNDRDALRDEKAATAAWMRDLHNFRVSTLSSDGVNYFDPKMNDALDGWVKVLAAKPELADVPDTEIVALAHKKVMIEYDLTPKSAAPAAAAAAAAPAKPKGRQPDLSNLPPTLGGLPAAAASDPGDEGEFGHLDSLTGMDYELALARLNPAQKARYEAM